MRRRLRPKPSLSRVIKAINSHDNDLIVFFIGEAEAFAIEAKAKAEAEQMAKKADAWNEYEQAAKIDMVLQALPQIAAEVSAPIAR